MKTPLYSKLLSYNPKARFHMPGHSGVDFGAFKANSLDITEVSDMDNLLCADGVIKEAEDLIAKAYGYKHALMVTAGSTICMQISAYLANKEHLKVVALGRMHNSFYNAMRLFNIEFEEYDSIQKLQCVIDNSQDRLAIFITSPTYFGNLNEVDKKGNLLIIDAAHGAHFAFSSVLPQYPQGDIVFSSMHKTTPALTGAAIINVNDDKLYEEIVLYRSIIHSTSPSYLIMSSMDLARGYLQENGEEAYKAIAKKVESYNGKFASFDIENTDDISRLVLVKKGIDAYKALDDLHKLGFEIEMAYEDKLVLILTPFNIDKLDELEKALNNLTFEYKKFEHINSENIKENIDENLVPEFVDIDDAEGYICNAEISIYPPSQPIINYGKKITKEDINILKAHLGHVLGLVNNKVPVLK